MILTHIKILNDRIDIQKKDTFIVTDRLNTMFETIQHLINRVNYLEDKLTDANKP